MSPPKISLTVAEAFGLFCRMLIRSKNQSRPGGRFQALDIRTGIRRPFF
jgi:hypothetical protein